MRLQPYEAAAIKAATSDLFGATAIVRLFGSRVDDRLRGGDIDLPIEVDELANEPHAKALFERKLFEQIDAQKVGVVITIRGGHPRGFKRIAYRDGIVL